MFWVMSMLLFQRWITHVSTSWAQSVLSYQNKIWEWWVILRCKWVTQHNFQRSWAGGFPNVVLPTVLSKNWFVLTLQNVLFFSAERSKMCIKVTDYLWLRIIFNLDFEVFIFEKRWQYILRCLQQTSLKLLLRVVLSSERVFRQVFCFILCFVSYVKVRWY